MDFHAAMETFAEAWVAANTPTAVNLESHSHKPQSYHSEESHMSAVRTHGHTLHLVGPGGGLILDRSIPGIHRPSPSRSHSVETIMKDPEQNITTIGGSAKSLPIHCIVEQISGTPSFDSVTSAVCAPSAVELDSYAILPSSTLLSDLVHSALVKLGYNSADAIAAKGAIQIKNWKPLTFDAITNNAQATVEEILSELTNVATLRIRIASHPKPSSAEEVKEKLLQLLLSQSHSLLNQTGCPINQGLLSSISKGDHSVKIPEDLTSAFDKWYKEQLKGQLCKNSSDLILREKTPEPDVKDCELSKENSPQASPDLKDAQPTPPQPYFMASRTRVRTSFDPEHEIPRLHKWFQENQHPSREQMIRYMNELNQLDSRKGRRPLDLTNIIYWFKNARAAQRRASKAVDDSFENEDNSESNATSLLSGHYPYLPNKNAVYVIPFPYHQQLAEQETGNDQPCDLSMNKSKDLLEEKVLDTKQNCCDENKHVTLSNGFENDNKKPTNPGDLEIKQEEPMEETTVEEGEKSPEDNMKSEKNKKDEERTVSDSSVHSTDCQKEEESQDRRLFYDDSSEDVSESESDDDDRSALVQKENIDHAIMSSRCDMSSTSMSAAASMAAMSLAQMAQPLHIPQLNPPLMTYYPMNTRFYSPHSNSVHEPVHGNTHKHHEPRKRRTRVFIDPLTEIPKLEKWFMEDTHPSAYMIDKFCDELNRSEYRQKFPSLKHVDWTTIWDDHAVRCATLGLLKELNQPTLAKLSPLCQSMISNIANGKYVNKLSMEKCKEFGEWYKQYKLQALDFPSISHKGTPKDTRLTFHPQHEVPLLKSWYAKCKHPSLEKLRFYCSELNKGHIRNARPPVTPARLKLWWKNEKQKERRQKKEEPACTSSQGQINPDSSSEMSVIEIRSDVQERCELDSSVHNIHRPIESSSMQILSTTYVDNQSWIH